MNITIKKAIIVGATSGIGLELAKELNRVGYELAICGRREELLHSLATELGGNTITSVMDISEQEKAMTQLESLIEQMKDVELIVLNAGIAHMDKTLPWQDDQALIAVNVSGFTALAGVAFRYFCEKKSGHIVGVSSILSLRGGPASAYNASKAYMSNYMQGMRFILAKQKLPVTVTDIRPGFVQTEMVKGRLFWVSTPQRAAKDIYKAIKKRKKVAYITPRWQLIAWLARLVPDRLYHRL